MKDVIFREKRLIDREKEIEFFKGWFEKLPKEILWVYGPKSTGKTTLIEYIIERELFDDFKLFKSEKYNIKYIDFRAKMIGNYDMFLQSLITPNGVEIDVTSSINLGIFKMDIKRYKAIQDKRLNFFDELLEEFHNSNKKNILVIDEIQKLEDIYIDKDK